MKAFVLSKPYLTLIKRFPLAPIADATQLAEALVIIKELSTPSSMNKLTKEELDYFEVLAGLVAKFEAAHWKPLSAAMEPNAALAYLMQEGGTTQIELAKAINIQQSHISEYLSGKRDMSKESIVKIAAYYKVSPELFLPRF